jgi:CheY-like chemotaxis protein
MAKTILVADDNPLIRKMLCELMRLPGLESENWQTHLPKVISKHCATREELLPTTPFLDL